MTETTATRERIARDASRVAARVARAGPRRYEAMILVDSGLASKDWDATEALLKDLLVRHGAKILVSGKWDERKLAYEIRGVRRATYWLAYFEGPTEAIAAFRHDAGLSETVLRSMVVAMEDAEEVPADVTSRRTTVAIGDENEIR